MVCEKYYIFLLGGGGGGGREVLCRHSLAKWRTQN